MTHIFDLELGKVFIDTEMREWEARFPVPGPDQDRALTVVRTWRNGEGPNRAEDMPKVLLASRPRKTWPDAFLTTNGLHVVSGRARDVIEGLDPGVHQFFPLTLQTKRGIEIEGPWFALTVYAKQDSIVLEKSIYSGSRRRPDLLNSFYGDTGAGDIVVDPSRQSDLNLWREQRFQGSLLGSHRLIECLTAQGVRFFPYYAARHLDELDEA